MTNKDINKQIWHQVVKLRKATGLNLWPVCGRINEENRILSEEKDRVYTLHTKEISKESMLEVLTITNRLFASMQKQRGPRMYVR